MPHQTPVLSLHLQVRVLAGSCHTPASIFHNLVSSLALHCHSRPGLIFKTLFCLHVPPLVAFVSIVIAIGLVGLRDACTNRGGRPLESAGTGNIVPRHIFNI